MTKTTKIIAALGVVAGLGVAALPLSSYAATVSGNVNVSAQVTDSIAMRIMSNADNSNYAVFKINPEGTGAAGETDTGNAVSQATGLEMAGNKFDYATLYSNISVRSNTGTYTLTVIDADTSNNLDLATPSATANEFIPSVEGDNQGLVRTTAGWGFYAGTIADAAAADGNIWNEVPTSDAQGGAKTVVAAGTNTPGSFSTDTTVHYGVASGATKTGTYSDTIVYTATNGS